MSARPLHGAGRGRGQSDTPVVSLSPINEKYLVYRLNVDIGDTDTMDYPLKTTSQLGALLKGFRRERELTQADLGARVGLAQNTVSDIEADPGRSSLGRVFKLLAAMELELVIRPRQPGRKSSEW